MRKIVHVADAWEGGGAESVLRATVEASRRMGLLTTVFLAQKAPTAAAYVFSLRAAARLLRLLRQERPDVVHFHNFYHRLSPSVLWAVRRYRRRAHGAVRVVYTSHDFHLLAPNSGFQYFQDGMRRNVPLEERPVRLRGRRWDHRSGFHSLLKITQYWWAYRFLHLQSEIDLIVSPSEFLKHLLETHLPSIPCVLIRNPLVDLDAPERTAPVADSNETGPIRVCFVGRLAPEKGLTEFVATVGESTLAQQVEFHVFGHGPELEAVRLKAKAVGLQIAFHGMLPAPELLRELQGMDVLALPSCWYENAPLVLMEAASIGLPTMTWNRGGMAEMSALTSASEAIDMSSPVDVAEAVTRLRRLAGRNQVLDSSSFSSAEFDRRLRAAYEAGHAASTPVPDQT